MSHGFIYITNKNYLQELIEMTLKDGWNWYLEHVPTQFKWFIAGLIAGGAVHFLLKYLL